MREAIILAGGLGTRLSHVVKDVPKPMAPIKDKPFLTYILDQLSAANFTHFVLSVGHKHAVIVDYFGNSYNNIPITYVIENEPLGTGGAIAKSLATCHLDNVWIINGDTFFEVNFKEMQTLHEVKKGAITLALKRMFNFDRYGTVHLDGEHRISAFHEKTPTQEGLINGGIYLLEKAQFDFTTLPPKFSFEKEVLEKPLPGITKLGYESKGYFKDIGIPEDYHSFIATKS